MRILLIGEYSGLFSNLKIGFLNLGYQVDFIHCGDGKKKIGGGTLDYDLNCGSKNYIKRIIHTIKVCKKLSKYEIVLMINPSIVSAATSILFFHLLKRKNNKIGVLSCGDTYRLVECVKKREFKYYMFEDDKEGIYPKVLTDYEKPYIGALMRINEEIIMRRCDVIIPTAYEYYQPFRYFNNITSGIPLPLDLPCEEPDFSTGSRIKIFYGRSKPFFKGGNYIEPALKIIQSEFPELVDIVIKDFIPYEEYKKCIDDIDILVDQCKSYGWGMNAIMAMGKGKIVLSGAEQESLDFFDLEEVPIINIRPDIRHICDQLRDIIVKRKEIPELKKKSYEFVKKFHDCTKAAEKYITMFN